MSCTQYSFVKYQDSGSIQLGLVRLVNNKKRNRSGKVCVCWVRFDRDENKIDDYPLTEYDKAMMTPESFVFIAPLVDGHISCHTVEMSLSYLKDIGHSLKVFELMCPFLTNSTIEECYKTFLSIKCQICDATQSEQMSECWSCNCTICNQCVESGCKERFNKNSFFWDFDKCFDTYCGGSLSGVWSQLSSQLTVWSETKLNKSLIRCECGTKIYWDKQQNFQCTSCFEFYCCKCGKSHDAIECDDELKQLGIKSCPSCHVKYSKTSGCNDVVCTECGTNFCHDCHLIAPEKKKKLFDKSVFPNHKCKQQFDLSSE